MKPIVWALRLLVFVALFGLAIKNDAAVELRFYFERAVQMPLSLVLLATFAAGVLVGLSAAAATLIRQRMELGRLRRDAQAVKE